MQFATLFASTMALVGSALALPAGVAIINVESSHGGAGTGLRNATINVEIGPLFTGDIALNAVSTLYLVGAEGVPVESITCIPYKAANGLGDHGLPLTSVNPSRLSTNVIQVGSILCTSG
ncbi:hypothetical protein F4804DRAFT_296141 [Jackrogersella minutella]|nr:hypothetical protein F4804DRAFT_296141 [Jackrogersella minutella]